MNCLIYVQHLSGTGHFVRMFEVAAALVPDHACLLTAAGRLVPRREVKSLQWLSLPALRRGERGLEAVEAGHSLMEVWRMRGERFRRAVEEFAPDVLLIEHFPFSKWELAVEISQLIHLARTRNPNVRIVCSIRDIVPATRHDHDTPPRRIWETLNQSFDHLLIHADPNLVQWDEHIPWTRHVLIPCSYTGYVSATTCPVPATTAPASTSATPSTEVPGTTCVVSAGGHDRQGLIDQVLQVWSRLAAKADCPLDRLLIFTPLFAHKSQLANWKRKASTLPSVELRSFQPSIEDEMASCALSISQAGYNSSVSVLRAGCRAILVPDPTMSDQTIRAERFQENGLATHLNLAEAGVTGLERAVREVSRNPKPSQPFQLNGATRTREILERLCATR